MSYILRSNPMAKFQFIDQINLLDLANEIVDLTVPQIIRWMNKTLDDMLVTIKAQTPEDTLKLLSNYEIERPKFDGFKVVWGIFNDTEWAIYVEFGLSKKWIKLNYHKPKGNVFYRGEWARMFEKARIKHERDLFTNIMKA